MEDLPEDEGARVIDLDKIRALLSAVRAGWKHRTSGQIAYDKWNETFAEDQIPRLIKAMEDLIQLAQCTVDDPEKLREYFNVTNR